MRLKQVKLSGFKSFCDNTEFSFQEHGITMVVGPNGCGKSNVVDAVRWALGEQSPRLMRSSAMGDVIFSGSTSRKPVGRAEVTLLFDNEARTALEKYNEFSEIAVTRRLYRSGESEYLINKLPCRLLDIRELLMDTGAAGRSYSIVEQGRVDEFVTATPHDRRGFMEEAAGIVRYKTKRIAAEKKLEQTRQNLLRVEDVLGELARQESQLRQQMEAAREYRALQSDVVALRGALARLRHGRSQAACAELATRLEALQNEAAAAAQALAAVGAEREAHTLEQTQKESALRESRAAIYNKERTIGEDEKALALQEKERENVRAWSEQLSISIAELERRQSDLAGMLAARREETATLTGREEQLVRELVVLETRHEERQTAARVMAERMTTWREEMLECDTQLGAIEAQQRFLAERMTSDQQRRTALAERVRVTGDELGQQHEALAAQGLRAGEIEANLAEVREELQVLEEMLPARAGELAEQRTLQEDAQREVLECRSRLETLSDIEAGYEGFGEAVRDFLLWADEHPQASGELGIVGPVANLVSIPAEVADWAGDFLAPHLETVVLERAEALPRAAERLAELGLGGVRFLPLDAREQLEQAGGNGNGDGNGAAVRLAHLLRCDKRAPGLDTVLFEAVRLLPAGAGPHPLPTPLGGGVEWLSRDGSLHIGSRACVTLGRATEPAAGILRRKAEMAALEVRLAGLEAGLAKRKKAAGKLAGQLETLTAQKSAQEETLNALLLEHKTGEQETAHGRREQARLEQALELARGEEAQYGEELKRNQAQQQQCDEEATRWRESRARLQDGMTGLRGEEEQARALMEQAAQVLMENKLELGRVLSRLEGLRAQLEQLEQDSGATARKLEESRADLGAQEKKEQHALAEIARLTAALEAHHQAMEGLREAERERREAFEVLAGGQRVLDERMAAERKRQEGVQGRMHQADLELAQERMRLEQYAGELAGLPPDTPTEVEGDEPAIEKKLAAGQARLQRMEGINLGAPEEYEALEERIGFLGGQKADLNEAITDLEDTIRRMNNESRRRFRETFEAVNGKFQQIFPEVFGGGEARLVMTDSDDPLEAGVDIYAQPPGKKLQTLNLLSGGEKALTAISLILSFFLHKPSPFCVLDEVDAPLDDVNVTRFNRIIQNMTDHSQFIIITHNKRTMEVADRLYGVTMEEAGVSKIVSVNLNNHD